MDSKAACVLCSTCANFVGRSVQERRHRSRVCAAGIVMQPTMFQCDSYLRQTPRAWAEKHLKSFEMRRPG